MGTPRTRRASTKSVVEDISDLVQQEGMGTEIQGSDEIQIPRLCVAQALSHQRKKSNPLYIPDLEEGQIFNDVTSRIYGESIGLTVISYLGKRGIEMDGNKIVDFNVPLDDPRLQWNGDEKPIATLLMDFVLLLDTGEVVLWSAKKSQIRTARRLNTALREELTVGDTTIANPPAWARHFIATSAEVPGDNPYYALTFKPDGIAPADARTRAACLYKGGHNPRQLQAANQARMAAEAAQPDPEADDGSADADEVPF